MRIEDRLKNIDISELEGREDLPLPKKLSIISGSGNASKYFKEGDTVIITLNNEPTTFEICCFDYYQDKFKNPCGITIISKESIGYYQMNLNSEPTNKDGWGESKLRQVLNSEVYNSIDSVWREVIRCTRTPIHYHGEYREALDFLFIPSAYEIYGDKISGRVGMGRGSDYYYKEYESVHKQEGTPIPHLYEHRRIRGYYWTRSAYLLQFNSFWCVNEYGHLDHASAYSHFSVRPCFSI